MARKVLVVGGAGYIGAHCAHLLQRRGDEVVVLDDLSAGHREAVSCELVVMDIRDRAALTGLLRARRFDAVMHFAALASVGESVREPTRYFDVNVAGSVCLVRAMADSGTDHLVFSSSCSIYGPPQVLPLDEDHPKAPMSPYGLSKWTTEQLLESLRDSGALRVSMLRYFNAAGAHPEGLLGESRDVETHLIPLAMDAVLGRRPPLSIFGRDYDTPDGTCIRDYVHVLDLAAAHLHALDAMWAGARGGTWNLGTGRGSSVLEVLTAVGRVAGQPVPVVDAPRRAGDPAALWAAVDQVKRDLGWSADYVELEAIVETAWRWARAPRY